jgi:hypothetical protein
MAKEEIRRQKKKLPMRGCSEGEAKERWGGKRKNKFILGKKVKASGKKFEREG